MKKEDAQLAVSESVIKKKKKKKKKKRSKRGDNLDDIVDKIDVNDWRTYSPQNVIGKN